MKGIVLAGGLGKRLYPLTKITNKHLLPVYDKPMIYYPIQTLIGGGIDEIAVVVGGSFAGNFIPLLENGEEFNLKSIQYFFQKKEGGIAEALALTKTFAANEPITVILGDNIFIKSKFNFLSPELHPYRAKIFLKKSERWQDFGIAEIKDEKVQQIVEKPQTFIGDNAVVGLYIYPKDIFEKISTLNYSSRGELEITDINNLYLRENRLDYEVLEDSVSWADCGTIDSLVTTTQLLIQTNKDKNEG